MPSSFLLSAIALLATIPATLAQTACNNSPDLCARSYGNITHLGAHDSPFISNASNSYTSSGNQNYNSTVQLSAGVRLLSAQVHKTNSSSNAEYHLCHSSCDLLDVGRLRTWLAEIKTWLDGNPNEVVTLLLVNSDSASAASLDAEYTAAGIKGYTYTPASTSAITPTSWPTLQQMISNGTRLVTFVASLTQDSTYPYLMDEFTYIFENAYENTSPSNFSCTPDRPSSVKGNTATAVSSNRLFLQNHFLYEQQAFGIQTPDTADLTGTNSVSNGTGALGSAISNCTSVYSRKPWTVLVDFFHVGPAISSVDRANSVSNSTTGRTSVGTTYLDSSTTTSAAAPGKGGATTTLVIGMIVMVMVMGL